MHLSVKESMQIPLCGATQALSLRWGCETSSIHLLLTYRGFEVIFASDNR